MVVVKEVSSSVEVRVVVHKPNRSLEDRWDTPLFSLKVWTGLEGEIFSARRFSPTESSSTALFLLLLLQVLVGGLAASVVQHHHEVEMVDVVVLYSVKEIRNLAALKSVLARSKWTISSCLLERRLV